MEPGQIEGYLPRQVVRRVHAHGGRRGQAQADRALAAFAFFDIAGFTRLSDAVGALPGGSAETLYEVISGVFGPIADACLEVGGDVLYFAGDGLGVAFFASDAANLGAATRTATSVAQEVVRRIGVRAPLPGIEVQVRAAIGAGPCEIVEVGGVDGRWVLVVDGVAMAQAHAADQHGVAGAVVASPEAWALLGSGFTGVLHEGGIRRIDTAPPPLPYGAVSVGTIGADELEVARTYLPPPLAHGLAGGAGRWMAELRQVTTVFLSIPGARVGQVSLQRAMVVCQEQMGRVGGFVHEVLGDKGLGFLCVLGAPPASHEDDAARAVDAALAIRAELANQGLGSGIGIATGLVYCGVVGSTRRRQYEMYGRSMALAARLMQATQHDGILVDARTRAAAGDRVEFDAPIRLKLKGFPDEVEGFRPSGRHGRRRAHASEMVGRSETLSRVESRLLDPRDTSGAVLIQADAGMGKSMLLDRVLASTRDAGRRVLHGAADAMEERTPLFALRGVVSDLLGLYAGIAPSQARSQVLERLRDDLSDAADLAPLLNALLPLDLPETPLTEQLTGAVRAENLGQLLVALFRKEVTRGPIVVAIEDLHWMDLGSWNLCERLVDDVPGLLLVGTMRPMNPPPAPHAALTRGGDRELITLAVLSRQDTAAVVAGCLGVTEVDAAVVDAVFTRSEGIPFYSEEVAYAMRDAGAMRITGSRVSLGVDSAALMLPGNVTGVITSRIDRLPPQVQVSLKAASVLGRAFELAALIALHPIAEARASCAEHVQILQQAALVFESRDSPGLFVFRHALTHETTYGMLTRSQRRELHRQVAERIETEHAADLSPFFGRLAEHWRHGEEPQRASHYSAKAADQALAVYDSRNAITLWEQAIALDQRPARHDGVRLDHARWQQQMGDAWYSVPDNVRARVHYEKAYELAGFATPRFGWRTPIEVLKHVIGRWMTPNPNPTPDLRERSLVALKAFDNLSVACLWAGDALGLVHVVFASDNIGRASGSSPEAALARNMVGYSLILAGLPGIGERDIRAAHAMAWSHDQIHARMVLDVFLGLTLTALSRVPEALPFLERGWELSRQLQGGLWKHRADFMIGEAHLISGRYAQARPYFQSCADISKGAEPHTQGFATAVALLCDLRRGVEPAVLLPVLESPEVGVPRTRREGPFGLQIACAIGTQMEVLLRLGRFDEAWDLAQEEMALAEAGDDTYAYFRGNEAHTQAALVVHALWERRIAGQLPGATRVPDAAALRAQAQRTLKPLRRDARTFSAAIPRHELFKGVFARIDGNPSAARTALARCVEIAERCGFPWEVVVGNVELARLSTGADREAYVGRARVAAAGAELVFEVSDSPSIGIGFPSSSA